VNSKNHVPIRDPQEKPPQRCLYGKGRRKGGVRIGKVLEASGKGVRNATWSRARWGSLRNEEKEMTRQEKLPGSSVGKQRQREHYRPCHE